uniref:Uncharacterized protein n=1 Tax=Octopus bimaculoides TaxID=37653 RepID=A0A0L8GA99_OCTBM
MGVSGVLHPPKTCSLVLHQENSKKSLIATTREKKMFGTLVWHLRMRKIVKVLL